MKRALRLLRAVVSLAAIFVLLSCGGSPLPTPEPKASPTIALSNPNARLDENALVGRILFVQRGSIWMWENNAGHLLMGGGIAWQPRWSPDGSRVAYIERGMSYSDLIVIDAQGKPMNQLTFNGSERMPGSIERVYESSWVFYPAWAPDGKQLLMAAQYGPPAGDPAVEYNLALYSVPAVGGNKRLVYADDGGQCGRSAYAPDGTTIALTLAKTGRDGTQRIYRVASTTGEVAPWAGLPASSYDPAFSPDGRFLAFAARDGERTDIFALPIASSAQPQRLTVLGTARAPTFSPDGRFIAFLAIPEGKGGFELWVAAISSTPDGALTMSPPRQVTRDLGLDGDSGLSWGL